MPEIKITSNFESGSIGQVSYEATNKIRLSLKNDNDDAYLNPCWRDWWYVKLEKVPTNKLIHIVIENKSFAYYYLPVYSYDRKIWHRMLEQEVSLLTDNRKETSTYSLIIQKEFIRSSVWIARFYPYTYSHYVHFKRKHENNPYLQIEEIGQSCGCLPIELMTITESSKRHSPAHRVFIQTRTHPGETGSSFVLEGLINHLLSHELSAKQARRNIIFNIVPMHNPDGVIAGNYRTNLNSVNLDEAWFYDPNQPERLIDLAPRENKAVNSKLQLWLSNQSQLQSPPVDMAINLHASNELVEQPAYFIPHFGSNKTIYNQQQRNLWHNASILSGAVHKHYQGRFDHPLKEGGIDFLGKFYPEKWWWINQQDKVLAVTLETTYGKAGFDHWVCEGDLRALGVALAQGILAYYVKKSS